MQKIDTYVTKEDALRLKNICNDYGFRSTYKLLQYLVHCFLRVVDSQNDPIESSIPIEIEEMFSLNSDWEVRTDSRDIQGVNRIYCKPDQRKIKTPDDLRKLKLM